MFGKLFGMENAAEQKEIPAEECEAVIYAMFAHKGGVAKTTNVVHLAFELANQGKRVLMVDADPQTTLSESLCSEANENMQWRQDIERGDLQQAWEAAYAAGTAGEPIPAAECALPDRADIAKKNGGAIFLLPGSLDTYKIERSLTYAQDLKQRHWLQDIDGFTMLRESIGVMRQMIHATARAYKADIVMVDMGPSICDLNFNLLFNSDYFIVPANADRYSQSSLRTLCHVLNTWAEQHEQLVETGQDHKIPIPTRPPKFAGVLFSRVPQSSRGQPIHVNALWMAYCCNVVTTQLIPLLREKKMVAPNIEEIAEDGYRLEDIPQFSKIHEMAMRAFAPVFGVPPELLMDVDAEGNEIPLKGKKAKALLDKGASYQVYFTNAAKKMLAVANLE